MGYTLRQTRIGEPSESTPCGNCGADKYKYVQILMSALAGSQEAG